MKTMKAFVFGLGTICVSTQAMVITQAVYVSSSGDNSHTGLSPATPWKDVYALDSHTFGPGAQILFRRGETFAGACALDGSGTPANPIIVAAYDSGDKPHLTGGSNQEEVFLLTSCKGIEFRDLHISNFNTNNASIKHRQGINLEPPENAGDMEHYRFINVDFSDIQGYGDPQDDHQSHGIFGTTANNDDAPVPTRWNDILIEGCTFADIDGRGARFLDTCLDIADVRIRGATNYYPTIGFVFQNNHGTNCYRNLLVIRGTQDALIQYNTMDTTVQGSAVWPYAAEDTLVQFNVFKHLRNPDTDSFVCHFDYNCIGTIMQYNYGYDVEGGLVQLLCNSKSPEFFQEGAIARYNIGVDVGFRDNVNSAGIAINGIVDGGQVYNNTIITLSKPVYKAISFHNWNGGWPSNNKIYNNVFYADGTASTYNQQIHGLQDGNVVSHNLYWGNVVPPLVWDGTPVDQNPFTGNPLFANPSGITPGDLKVMYGSSAISNGMPMAANGGRDFFGYAVSSNELPTLGFHEYRSDPVIDSDGDKMYDLWESGYGLNPGSAADATADPDSDRLKNLGEFAVGGDPTNGADIGYVPVFAVGTNVLYVYPRRTDWADAGLVYDLGVSADLMNGPWTNGAHWIDGIGAEAYGPGFDAVTNHLSLNDVIEQRFIRLEIGGL